MQNFYWLHYFQLDLLSKLKWYLHFFLAQIVHSSSNKLFLWKLESLSKFQWHVFYIKFTTASKSSIRVFFKFLSSWSFVKSRRLWVQRTHMMGFLGGMGPCSPWKIFENWNLSQFPVCTNYAFIYQNPIWWTTNHVVHTFLPLQQELFKMILWFQA